VLSVLVAAARTSKSTAMLVLVCHVTDPADNPC
jgi:hypothetical protein